MRLARFTGASLSAVIGRREAVEQLTHSDIQVTDHLQYDTNKHWSQRRYSDAISDSTDSVLWPSKLLRS